MIEIQSVCTECGAELELELTDLLLLLPVDSDPDVEPRLLHGCPVCDGTTVRTVDWRLARVLMAHAAAALPDLELEPAVELHPEDPPGGSPWSVDDVIELHGVLERDDWFDQLVASGPAA
jgi:hypothetical protein